MNKGGQFQIGFNIIFSLILIAVFIVVAFIAIRAFLDIGCGAETGKLIQDLNSETEKIRKGAGEDRIKEFKISGCSFTHVCFYDPEKASSDAESNVFARDFHQYVDEEGEHNLFFYPRLKSEISSTRIKFIDMEGFDRNPYCLEKIDNKINIRFRKNLDEVFITLS